MQRVERTRRPLRGQGGEHLVGSLNGKLFSRRENFNTTLSDLVGANVVPHLTQSLNGYFKLACASELLQNTRNEVRHKVRRDEAEC